MGRKLGQKILIAVSVIIAAWALGWRVHPTAISGYLPVVKWGPQPQHQVQLADGEMLRGVLKAETEEALILEVANDELVLSRNEVVQYYEVGDTETKSFTVKFMPHHKPLISHSPEFNLLNRLPTGSGLNLIDNLNQEVDTKAAELEQELAKRVHGATP